MTRYGADHRRTTSMGYVWAICMFGAFLAAMAWLSSDREIAEDQKNRAADAARWRETTALCRAASACRKYDEVRLECATAGSFKTCLRIKMGDDMLLLSTCTSDWENGAPANMADMPGRAECTIHR